MRSLILGVGVLLVASGAAVAQDVPVPSAGQRHGEAGQATPCPMHAAMAESPRAALQLREELGLSTEQVQQLEAAHQQMHAAHQQLMPRMREVHASLTELAGADAFDEGAARVALQRAGELHAEMMLAALRGRHETRAVLTAGQRERLASHAAHAPGAMHGAEGPGMGMMCPMMGHGMQPGAGHRQP